MSFLSFSFFLSKSPFQYLALGILSIFSALIIFIRGIAKSDFWGPQLMDLFPALFDLISVVLLCVGKSITEEIVFLSLTCFLMMKAFIAVLMSHDVRYYYKTWGVSIIFVLFALFLSLNIVPGYYFSLLPITVSLQLFLALQAFLLFRIAFIERKLEQAYKKTVQEIQTAEKITGLPSVQE